MPGGLLVDTPDLISSGYFEAITKSDDTVLTGIRGVYVGGVGNLVVKDQSGNQATFAVIAGALLPISPSRVMAATSATGLVALY